MDRIRNSILATIVFYDILDFPLSDKEVFKYLINPSRFSITSKPTQEIKTSDVNKELANLAKLNFISSKDNLYFLKNRNPIFFIREERIRIAKDKWNKFLKLAKWLQAAPYVRGFFVSGSLAMDNTDEESDFDVLFVIKPSRLYTARLFLLAIASVLKARRKKTDITAPDKLCFNHYISEDNLHIDHHSLFNAQFYAHLKPVFVSRELHDNFFAANSWINKYLYNFRPRKEFSQNHIRPNKFLLKISQILELILDSKIGDVFENWARRYQHKRIRNNPQRYNSQGRITANDDELEFHPNSFEKFLLNKYNETVKKLGIIMPFEEKDSGLT